MPFYNASRKSQCMAETTDAIAMLDTIIEQHPDHLTILGGDFNSELKGNSPFDPLWRDFISRHKLACCSSRYPANSVTYHHKSLDQKKWIDHFVVSPSLLENDLSNFSILDDGDNFSDHYPIMMKMRISFKPSVQIPKSKTVSESLKWAQQKASDIEAYTARLSGLTDALPAPKVFTRCQATCLCDDELCKGDVQAEYDNLINCILSADSILPRHRPGVQKKWWTEGLTEMKKRSIEAHTTWKNAGRPRQGLINDERLRIRAAYKSALKKAQKAPKQASWDRLHSALSDNDTTSFWKSWKQLYSKNTSQLPPVVNGCSSNKDIANIFMESFKNNSTPNNPEKVNNLNSRFTKEHSNYMESHRQSCDCGSTKITVVNVIDALLSMNPGKSADADGITAEHLHHAPLNFLSRAASLFNAMLKHSYVPHQFRTGIMIPLIKDQQGNHSDTSNYRGITISPVFSKILEHILKATFFDYLSSSQHQYGFKKNSSTVHALHCLRETVTLYVNNDSRVFCSFLDASKAFDRLVHSGLFLKLMHRKVPVIFLNIIISWYEDLRCCVKWGDQFSDWFNITAGVRQGGILSPDFYSIYVDGLLQKLRESKKGCYFRNQFAAALFYADDMALLSPSIRGLRTLLNICEEYCREWDIRLNDKKTKNLYFGKRINISHDLLLNGNRIEWVDEWVYLGVTLKSSKVFDCSVKDRIKKFYRCANAILRIDGRSNDLVMLRLLEAHCIPLLTYATEIIHVSNRDDRRQLRVAYNSLFRKLFCYRWTESVSALQSFLGRPTWEELVDKRRASFVSRIRRGNSSSLAYQLLLWS